jgi:hypothetical protein
VPHVYIGFSDGTLMSALKNSGGGGCMYIHTSAQMVVWITAPTVIHSDHKNVKRGTEEFGNIVRTPDLITNLVQSVQSVPLTGHNSTSFDLCKVSW